MAWMTTTRLLDDLRESDEAAWQRFVERFRQPIVRFARDLGMTGDDAEDIAQETLVDFIRAYRAGQYDRDKGRLRAWLFGIAHRRVLNARRRLARAPHTVPPGQRTALWSTLPDDDVARRSWDVSWQQCILDQCIKQVRTEVEPSTIRAFELFAIEGQPAAEVARTLGCSRNAVFIAKHRVLKRVVELRREIEEPL
jgi:RNA polymerase sigma-70 factor (ECF subfamily)